MIIGLANLSSIDPYARRAGQLSLHYDLLAPPNWFPGQDPIREAEAQDLYDRARVTARKEADYIASLIEHADDREERLETLEEHWHSQLRMDELIFRERCRIRTDFVQSQPQRIEHTEGLHKLPRKNAPYRELSQRSLAGALPSPMIGLHPVSDGSQQIRQVPMSWNRKDTPSPSIGTHQPHGHLKLTGEIECFQ